MKDPRAKDPKRIDEVLDLISKIWHKNPDLRLCQLIGNLFWDIDPLYDTYYVEDDELQDELTDKYL